MDHLPGYPSATTLRALLGLLVLSGAPLLGACSGDDPGDDDEEEVEEPETGVAALGGESHSLESVRLTVEGTDDDGLNVPRDLAFNPDYEGELWVVNRKDDSTTTFYDVGTDSQEAIHLIDPYAFHFMEEVSTIAFGEATWDRSDERTFATCHESRNTYNGQAAPNDFMGPSLWSADMEYYAQTNEDAVEYLTDLFGFYTDLGSHLDMLHESPLCMGIEYAGEGNQYWVFDGHDGSIVFYDFAEDHDAGYDDHSDGIILRYVTGEVERVEDVPSHLTLDQDSGLLFIADTGNNRIAVLDTESGEEGGRLSKFEPGTTHKEMEGADLWTLVDGDDVDGMSAPSGLELIDGHLIMTDNESGTIFAFDLEGNVVDYLQLDVEEGSLMGITGTSLEDLWLVDANADELLRLRPAD